jgi:hypothetical protein
MDLRTTDACLSEVSLLSFESSCFVEEHDYKHYPFGKLVYMQCVFLLSFRNADRILLF